MNRKNKNMNLSVYTLVIACLLSSCVPIIHTKFVVNFRNCTNDTLIIVASHYDNIDSVDYQLWPRYLFPEKDINTAGIGLCDGIDVSREIIFPDSICGIDSLYLFDNNAPCFFFLIKWGNAKRYSWDEICNRKMFNKWIAKRNEEGGFDRNITYENPDEHYYQNKVK